MALGMALGMALSDPAVSQLCPRSREQHSPQDHTPGSGQDGSLPPYPKPPQ